MHSFCSKNYDQRSEFDLSAGMKSCFTWWTPKAKSAWTNWLDI
jgi:hypothetical protein